MSGADAALARLRRHGKISVPRLIDCSGQRNIRAKLDDHIVLAKKPSAEIDDGRVRDQWNEPANAFAIRLEVETIPATRGGSALMRHRLHELDLQVRIEVIGPRDRHEVRYGNKALFVNRIDERRCVSAGWLRHANHWCPQSP
jgi:hypothetical protein